MTSERKNYRIYFNSRHEGKDSIWSVDEGDQSTERFVGYFILNRISARSLTDITAVAPAPSGWIFVANCYADFDNYGGVVFRSK